MMYLVRPALAECIVRAIGRHEVALRYVMDAVLNDYGSVSHRHVSRYLDAMVRYGDVEREGSVCNHRYRLPTQRTRKA